MSDTEDDFAFDGIIAELKATTVKQTYQVIASNAGKATGLSAPVLYKKLMEQERKATSGIGGGVAIPHLRLRQLDKPYSLLVRLPNLVDFNAVDDRPVGLLCLLLSPDNDVAAHLRRLSRVTRMLRDETLCSQLKDARKEDTIRALLLASHYKLRAA